MSAAAVIVLEVAKGDALVVNATHVVSATDLTPVDITGWTIAGDARQHINDLTTLFTFTPTVVLGTAGTYTWTFTHAQTLLLQSGDIVISLFRINTGVERLMATGTLTVDADARYGY